jgi:hypothetical protein
LYLRAQNESLKLSLKAYDTVMHSSYTYEATIDTSVLRPWLPDKKKKEFNSGRLWLNYVTWLMFYGDACHLTISRNLIMLS